ncbi:MAG: hypothetical protein KN64_00670 [Sulfurovum sp. AS07-7]|nr:MAG: hypothetical protein KN64_00670 [Sulfurovum sp. AS07-7]
MQNQKIITTLNDDLFIGEGMGRKCYIHPKINEFTFKCFKNPLNSSYKFIIMKDGKLIGKGAGE